MDSLAEREVSYQQRGYIPTKGSGNGKQQGGKSTKHSGEKRHRRNRASDGHIVIDNSDEITSTTYQFTERETNNSRSDEESIKRER